MVKQEEPPIVERIARFVARPASDDFDRLAVDAFAYQYRTIPPYRRLCRSRGATPQSVRRWQDVPAVPAGAFAGLALHAAPPREVFRSSGTTGGPRSVHYHPFPDLYRRVIDASFPAFCLPEGGRPPMLSLIPSRRQLPDSSLAFMVDHVLRRYGGSGSLTAFGDGGVDAAAATAWCRRRIAEGRPVFVLATAFALLQWLDELAAQDVTLALPPATTIFETGGFKGRSREIGRGELLDRIARRLQVPAARVVREYGMTELTSQLYSRVLQGGDPDLLVGPPWLAARVLEPASLEPAAPGEAGLIAIFDLANVGSAVHLLTGDLGIAEAGGIRLLGRAAGAELRGCSLTVEELLDDATP